MVCKLKLGKTMELRNMFTVGFMLHYLFYVNGFILDINNNSGRTGLTIQAEEMEITNGSVNSRSRASNLESVHLYQGSTMTFDFCLMSTTLVHFNEVIYSNDGPADRISVYIDNAKVGEFKTVSYPGNGGGWNMFRSSGYLNGVEVLTEGRHTLKLSVELSDAHGVEIDVSEMTFDSSQNVPSLKCMAFCFDDITYSDNLTFPSRTHESGFALQKSSRTQCAEEDNINIPVFHPTVSSFIVSATKPKYTSFTNSRGAIWDHCQMMQAFWSYPSVRLNDNIDKASGKTASMSIKRKSSNMATILVAFPLKGPKAGSTDAFIGTNVFLNGTRTGKVNGRITFKFQYFGKSNRWSTPQIKTITSGVHDIKFTTPDFAFSESNSNRIRIQVETFQGNLDDLVIGYFYMFKRDIKKDVSETIYKDSTTIVEGVHVDMWWRINETMSVSITNSNQEIKHFAYIRIYERVPWEDYSFSQIFVMYQDGNVRLLQITPHGLDWIPFGSSVLIGQSDPREVRPSAPIKHLQIDPHDMLMTITYSDGGWINMKIKPAWQETVLEVSNSSFARNTNDFPFFTFRSMWIENGNGDVDHVTVDRGKDYQTLPILGNWTFLKGNFFAFYRKCISKHNTLSPDILLKIIG